MVDTTNPKASNEADSDHFAESGAPGIEITPAMIESGVTVLWDSGAIETPMDGVDQELVRKIFAAMSRCSKEQS
jgi:hypothetical protein